MLERQEGAAGSSICGPRYLEDVTKETAGVCVQQGRHIAHKFESGWEVGVIKAFDKKGPHAGKFSVKYMDTWIIQGGCTLFCLRVMGKTSTGFWCGS
jgi:hypothetical protein